MAVPILLGAMAQASGFVGKGVLKGGVKTAGMAGSGVLGGAKFIASLPKKILNTVLHGPTKILGFLGKIIGKPLGLLGISTSISSLLRQSQIFTGSIGALLQMVGAFIDIMLAPFMPYFASLMEKMGGWIPKITKFSEQFHDVVVNDVWPWLKKQPKAMLDRLFGTGTWTDLENWFGEQDWKKWLRDPQGMLENIKWDTIASKFSNAFQVLAKDIGDAVKWAFTQLQNLFLGKQAVTWKASTIHDPNLEGGFGAMAEIEAGGLGPRSGGLWQTISEGFSNIDWVASTTSVMKAFGFSDDKIDTLFSNIEAIKTAVEDKLGVEYVVPSQNLPEHFRRGQGRFGIHESAGPPSKRWEETGEGWLGNWRDLQTLMSTAKTAASLVPGVTTLSYVDDALKGAWNVITAVHQFDKDVQAEVLNNPYFNKAGADAIQQNMTSIYNQQQEMKAAAALDH
tara:strand:- start:4519 stop:5874 length:1356 start_codon:yes stop_codon:yes gene_type:complete